MKQLFFSVLCALFFVIASCGHSQEPKQKDSVSPDTGQASVMATDSLGKEQAAVYICPCGGCPEIRESHLGLCSKCGIDLVVEKK